MRFGWLSHFKGVVHNATLVKKCNRENVQHQSSVNGSHFSRVTSYNNWYCLPNITGIVRAASKAELFTHVKLGMCVSDAAAQGCERSQRPNFAPRSDPCFCYHCKILKRRLKVFLKWYHQIVQGIKSWNEFCCGWLQNTAPNGHD